MWFRRVARRGGEMIMKPEEFAARLVATPGLPLVSVILYGSAAAGDHAGKRSDYNVMVVLDRVGAAELDAMAPAVRAWTRAGNPPPQVFPREGLEQSADVFPIELADMKDHHRMLHGLDVLVPLEIELPALRLELERELKVNLMRMQERYLAAAGRASHVAALMRESVATFGVLARAALRLFEGHGPAGKREALVGLSAHVRFDPEPFLRVLGAKTSGERIPSSEIPGLFARYLAAAGALADGIDQQIAGLRPAR